MEIAGIQKLETIAGSGNEQDMSSEHHIVRDKKVTTKKISTISSGLVEL